MDDIRQKNNSPNNAKNNNNAGAKSNQQKNNNPAQNGEKSGSFAKHKGGHNRYNHHRGKNNGGRTNKYKPHKNNPDDPRGDAPIEDFTDESGTKPADTVNFRPASSAMHNHRVRTAAEHNSPAPINTPDDTAAPKSAPISVNRIPDFSAFDFDTPAPTPEKTDEAQIEVVGVRFKRAGKVYYFAPGDIITSCGDFAIVETARGPEYGEVQLPNCRVPEKDIIQPLRPLLRIATAEDAEHNEENRRREREAYSVCLEKIEKHSLDMKLVDAQYTFDNSKLLFYFTSSGRVDFRELVKDLASVFRTRIELRQIGIRDEAKLLGGLGVCGRSLCCASFLSDFVQVSIKMAKEQNLSLNSNKISGSCGRLMCCLRYEHDTYTEEIRRTPPLESVVRTVDGDGVVIETNPLMGTVKVRLNAKTDTPPKNYHRDDVKILSRPQFTDRDTPSGQIDE